MRDDTRKGRAYLKPRYLGAIFILAVIVPSILLAVLSIRAAGREEAFIEKQLHTALLVETTHTALLADSEVKKIAQELKVGLDAESRGAGLPSSFQEWKSGTGLVGVPFLLSPRYDILWPRLDGRLDPEERLFLEENAAFLGNKAATTLFRNIALVYRDEILQESRRLEEKEKTRAKKAAPASPSGLDAMKVKSEPAPRERAALVPAPAAQSRELPRAAPSGLAQAADIAVQPDASSPEARTEDRAAIESFAQSQAIRQEVYKQAREKGDALGTRNVIPEARMNEPSPPTEGQSLLVAEQGTFGQIAGRAEFGIIPRFISDRLTFIFWERLPDGRIAGCRIEDAVFRSRIASVVSSSYTDARILAVLDERGEPLAAPSSAKGRDWRRPFVSSEIGESLPRWEAASYLADPGRIASQARATSLAIWILVLILFVSVASGGTLVLGSLFRELRLARNKATFVTNVSHELKTPLTSISLFAELLKKGKGPGPEKAGQYLDQISAETERLTRLINNVLDFSSMEKGKKIYRKKPVDAVEVSREILESQRARLENAGFYVGFQAAEEDLFIEADAEALKQVILNLISNAEKYSPERKSIEVQTSREGAGAVIRVRDRGIGVPEKHRGRIFQEFYRIDDSLTSRVKGTGLGLTIARRIARDLGGDLTHQPREGGGSDFVIRLPAGPDAGGGLRA